MDSIVDFLGEVITSMVFISSILAIFTMILIQVTGGV